VLALADGVGGHPGGDLASAAMVRPFAEIDFTLEGWDGADHLRTAAFQGDDAIAEQVAIRPELDRMATTRRDLGFRPVEFQRLCDDGVWAEGLAAVSQSTQ
jgi:serine/threonine protein phosphatase PrpC